MRGCTPQKLQCFALGCLTHHQCLQKTGACADAVTWTRRIQREKKSGGGERRGGAGGSESSSASSSMRVQKQDPQSASPDKTKSHVEGSPSRPPRDVITGFKQPFEVKEFSPPIIHSSLPPSHPPTHPLVPSLRRSDEDKIAQPSDDHGEKTMCAGVGLQRGSLDC